MTGQKLRAVLVGAGRWGQNLLRVLRAHPGIDVCAVVDPEVVISGAPSFARLDDAFALSLDLAVIASPPDLHAAHALDCLDRGLHVLVEKPLAMRVADADAVVARARASGLVAMVGHLLLHHPAVRRLLTIAGSGALGDIRYVASSRRSPPSRIEPVGALWSLGPHDVAVLHALDPSRLAVATSFALARAGDVVTAASASFRLESGVAGHFELSTVHAYKERRLVVVGDRAVLVFDDLEATRKLVLARIPEGRHEPASWAEALADASSTTVIPLDAIEPLTAEVDDFVRAITTGSPTRTPIDDGALVVRWLAAAES